MACILVELYTGELFFDTHENIEHLAMIEKQCGVLPYWMRQNCANLQIERHLVNGNDERVQSRLRWPAAAKDKESERRVRTMLLLDDIILDEFGPEHIAFKQLLKSMLVIDHNKRPNAEMCL